MVSILLRLHEGLGSIPTWCQSVCLHRKSVRNAGLSPPQASLHQRSIFTARLSSPLGAGAKATDFESTTRRGRSSNLHAGTFCLRMPKEYGNTIIYIPLGAAVKATGLKSTATRRGGSKLYMGTFIFGLADILTCLNHQKHWNIIIYRPCGAVDKATCFGATRRWCESPSGTLVFSAFLIS
jgi:hypothetical protein